jgi:cytochrome c556
MSNRHNPTEPHPFARDVEYVSDEWREQQAEMRAEQGCVGDECDGCPQCWVPELDQTEGAKS